MTRSEKGWGLNLTEVQRAPSLCYTTDRLTIIRLFDKISDDYSRVREQSASQAAVWRILGHHSSKAKGSRPTEPVRGPQKILFVMFFWAKPGVISRGLRGGIPLLKLLIILGGSAPLKILALPLLFKVN